MHLLYSAMPPPTLFSPSKTSLITGLPGIVIIIPLYIVYLTKTHSWGEKLIFSLGSAPFGSFTFCYIFNFLFTNLFYMNLLMSLFPADPVFTVTILHLDLPLFCYILFPKCIFFFYSFIFIFFVRLQGLWAMRKLDSSNTWKDWMRSFLQRRTTSKLCASCGWWSAM